MLKAILQNAGIINPANVAITGGTISGVNLIGSVDAQTGSTYTLTASDLKGPQNKVTLNNAGASTLTLPQQSTTTTVTGQSCWVENTGAGAWTIVKQGSETLTGNTTLAPGAGCFIYRDTTTNWNVFAGTATVNLAGIDFLIQTVANNTYVLMGYVGTPMTVLGVYEKARALTTAGTFSLNINGVAITSLSAVVPSTAGHYVTATGANTCVRGDQITIVYSGTSVLLDHNITIDATVQY